MVDSLVWADVAVVPSRSRLASSLSLGRFGAFRCRSARQVVSAALRRASQASHGILPSARSPSESRCSAIAAVGYRSAASQVSGKMFVPAYTIISRV